MPAIDPKSVERAMDWVSRLAFGTTSLTLMAMSLALVGYSSLEMLRATSADSGDFTDVILRTIGNIVIAIAVFDLAKYFIEEEVIRGRELRILAEARRSLTKFISTISIAVFIESLVTVVRVSKEDVERMLYPNLLLLSAIAIVVGLGLYQRLSLSAERRDAEKLEADDAIPRKDAKK